MPSARATLLTLAGPSTSLASLVASQAVAHPECASCQAVNGILPADGFLCGDHGTHVASTVGGLDYGVAKNVTLVPAFSCFKFRCLSGRFECGSSSDIRANLEYTLPHRYVSRSPRSAAPPPPPHTHTQRIYRPYPSRPCSHRCSPAPNGAAP